MSTSALLRTKSFALSACKTASSLAQRLEDRAADIAKIACVEGGFPVKVTRRELNQGITNLRSMDIEANKMPESFHNFGRGAAIVAYDASTMVFARIAGGALLTDTEMVFGFSSHIPRTAGLIADACEPFPKLKISMESNNTKFAQRAMEDDQTRYFFFSGGKSLGEQYISTRDSFDKLVFGGPGGLPPAIVLPDADVNHAARVIAQRSFCNGGQYCLNMKRALVHRSKYDEFLRALQADVQTLVVGDPSDERTDIGPITVSRTRESFIKGLSDYFTSHPECRQLTGSVNGQLISPHILTMPYDAIPDVTMFGPMLIVSPYDDINAVTTHLSRSDFGLAVYIFGNSLSASNLATYQQNFGAVWVNSEVHYLSPNHFPLGGRKTSGWSMERNQQGAWQDTSGPYLHTTAMTRTTWRK